MRYLSVKSLKADSLGKLASEEWLPTLPGIPPKVLSARLHELEKEGYIECVEKHNSPMVVRWALTQKGNDTLPMLMRFIAFGSKWYPDVVFPDIDFYLIL